MSSKPKKEGGFFASLTDKAKTLAAKLDQPSANKESQAVQGAPSTVPGSGKDSVASPSSGAANVEQSGSLSGRHHGIELLSHQFNSLKAQYS